MFQTITACVCDQIASLSHLIDKAIIACLNSQGQANGNNEITKAAKLLKSMASISISDVLTHYHFLLQ